MSYLQEGDATAARSVTGVIDAVPFTFVGGGIRNGKKIASSLLVATQPAWFTMRPTHFEEGRALIDTDTNVVVIGSVAKDELFGGKGSALGRTVTINGSPYRVVGVTTDKKSEQSLFSMGSLQNLVYVPFGYFKSKVANLQVDRIMIHVQPDAEPKALIKKLDAQLSKRLDHQQFQVLTQEDLLGLVYKLMSILTWLLTGLTSIGLFVGGVGIMTVMLMSVNERSVEIGIRKAAGAKRSDIFKQFLAEAATLALLGGLVGLLFSALVCWALTVYTPVKPLITFGIVGMAVSVSLVVGCVFGLIPAMNAARKDPVGALRSQ
jgi:putative ABC transport system permease protein